MNARIAAKRQVIAVATNNLARDYEFDDITVDMICERAEISRSTFYRLFPDKYSILTWCEEISFSRGIAQLGRSLTCLEGVTVTLECFRLFNSLFLSTQHSSERISRENAGKREAARLLRATVTEIHGLSIDEELDFQIGWFVSGFLEQCVTWSKAQCPNSVEDLALLIVSCCPQKLRNIFDNPQSSKNPEDVALQNIVIEGPLR